MHLKCTCLHVVKKKDAWFNNFIVQRWLRKRPNIARKRCSFIPFSAMNVLDVEREKANFAMIFFGPVFSHECAWWRWGQAVLQRTICWTWHCAGELLALSFSCVRCQCSSDCMFKVKWLLTQTSRKNWGGVWVGRVVGGRLGGLSTRMRKKIVNSLIWIRDRGGGGHFHEGCL